MLPVLGTSLVLLSQCYTSSITGNFIFQKIGLWSYSIYLWHWPIVVLGEFVNFTYWTLYGFIASILFGWLSYAVIESKNLFSASLLKQSKSWTAPIVVTTSCILFFISTEIASTVGKMYPERIEPFAIGISYEENGKLMYPEQSNLVHINKSVNDQPEYLLIGDSNAAHFAFGIASEDTRHYALSWVASCLNFPDYTTKPYAGWMNTKWRKQCESNYKRIYEYKDVDVILAQHWVKKNGIVCISDSCEIDLDTLLYLEVLENQLEKLVSLIGSERTFYIIGYVPAPINSLVQCMKKLINDHCENYKNSVPSKRIEINEWLESFASKHKNVKFINPFLAFCTEKNNCKTVVDGKNVFFDEGHLSQFGSRLIWRYISTQLE